MTYHISEIGSDVGPLSAIFGQYDLIWTRIDAGLISGFFNPELGFLNLYTKVKGGCQQEAQKEIFEGASLQKYKRESVLCS